MGKHKEILDKTWINVFMNFLVEGKGKILFQIIYGFLNLTNQQITLEKWKANSLKCTVQLLEDCYWTRQYPISFAKCWENSNGSIRKIGEPGMFTIQQYPYRWKLIQSKLFAIVRQHEDEDIN